MREPLIRSNDILLLTADYFSRTKQALLENPDSKRIHFSILTHNCNLKLEEPLYERYTKYELQVVVDLEDVKKENLPIEELTNKVLSSMYEYYKTSLIIH